MIVYKDIFSGDELFSDSYKVETVNDIYFKVKGKWVTEVTDCSNVDIGGNKSAEEPTEETDDVTKTSGCNIALANRMSELGYTKAEYKKYIKKYCQRIIEHLQKENPGRVSDFKAKMPEAVKTFLEKYDNLKSMWGESYDDTAMIPLLEVEDDGTCYMFFWKDGVAVEKY